jgi:NitT/TauT family transport system substrate-binding protein
MMRTRVSGAVLALAAIALLAAAPSKGWPAPPLPRVVLRFDTRADGAQAPFFLALARGWYRTAGVEAILEPGEGPEDAARAVQEGRADIGMGDTLAVLSLRARGMRLSIVASLGDRSPLCVFSRSAAGITKPEDLAGKKLGVDPLGISRALFPLFCEGSPLRQEDVTFVPLDPARRLEALAGGSVDAVTGTATEGPALARALGAKDMAVLAWADSGFAPYGACLFVREDAVQRRAPVIRAFLSASFRGWRASLAAPEAAVAAYGKAEAVETAGMAEEIAALTPLFDTKPYRTRGIGWIDGARMEETAAAAGVYLGAPLAGPAASAWTAALLPRPPIRMPAPKPAPAAATPAAAPVMSPAPAKTGGP